MVVYIAENRKKAKMTQSELAKRLKVNQTAISQWEAGRTLPRTELLPSIAEALGCTINDLFKNNDESKKRRLERGARENGNAV